VSIPGVDYSYSRPDLSELVRLGKRFVVRYVSRDPHKCITRTEAQAIAAHKLQLVLVFEDAGNRALGSKADGRADAEFASRVIASLGEGHPQVCYWAVDFDTAGNPGVTDRYASGWASWPKARTGPYGSYEIVEHHRRRGFGYGWQTNAWSYGRWSPLAQLRQHAPGMTLAGGSVDLCEAMTSDYGQYMRPHTPGTTLTPGEWRDLLDWVRGNPRRGIKRHYAPYLWGHAWSVLTSNPKTANLVWQREFGAKRKAGG
jgi:hypothetical protein